MTEAVRREVTIVNKLGLHARAAAKFVTLASQFQSEIHLTKDNRHANAKSIMGVMMLAAGRGASIEIEAVGADSQQAVEELEMLIRNRFGESE
jgi:phosphocarrier protein HPr